MNQKGSSKKRGSASIGLVLPVTLIALTAIALLILNQARAAF